MVPFPSLRRQHKHAIPLGRYVVLLIEFTTLDIELGGFVLWVALQDLAKELLWRSG